jgi:cytochrome c5
MGLGLLTACGDTGPSSAGANQRGETIYNRSCFSCHAAGVAGAPVPGDEAAWAPRIAKGRAALIESVKNGMPPGMPPMGLCTGCTDEDIAAAVDYMLP